MNLEKETQLNQTQPLRIGRRLVVAPLEYTAEFDPSLIPLRLEAGGVFGSGTHPTTQLCLKAVERHLTAGATVVDLGTGTGILAIAAAKLGAARVLALDIDATAVQVAQTNVLANGVARQVQVQSGSLAEVLVDQTEGGPAKLVVVNILAHVVETLLQTGLATTVQPGGLLILSGLLAAQTPVIRAGLQWNGLKQVAQEQQGEWVCLLAQRV